MDYDNEKDYYYICTQHIIVEIELAYSISRVQITDLVFLKFTKFDGRIGGKMHYNMAFDTKRKKHTYALLYLVATNLIT